MRATVAVIIALVVALLLSVIYGMRADRKADDQERKAEAALVQIGLLQSALVTEAGKERIVTRFVDRVQTVYRTGATIVREIPHHVTPQADRACVIPVGFVRVHSRSCGSAHPRGQRRNC